jgi:hypothetical protein
VKVPLGDLVMFTPAPLGSARALQPNRTDAIRREPETHAESFVSCEYASRRVFDLILAIELAIAISTAAQHPDIVF